MLVPPCMAFIFTSIKNLFLEVVKYSVTIIAMRSLGIDIGGTSVKAALIDGTQVIWTAQSDAYCKADAATLLASLRASVAERLNNATFGTIGVCVPGILDAARSRVMMSVNVPGLTSLPLQDLIQQGTGVKSAKLRVINDAFATASDVVNQMKLTRRTLVMALGTGVGMGILDDARPLMVDADSPGHIGQVDVSIDSDAPIGPDGGAGSLEGYIGVPALIARYGSAERFLEIASMDESPMKALARALRICHAIYRPHHIVLAGGIGIRLQRLIPQLRDAVQNRLTSVARPDWTLATGIDDFHAARGAARLALID